ncbi:putative membrane protein [Rhodoligotrophos appendicifer]|uniref:DUF2244 domain-containing protein n=1 Tax=Rhodoligotrophos appendicifer TaxID=987056 RepID=UPI00147922FD|nr:DUF2244 domain-containing protein [Rhodoligotrophos appendicifer]
MKNIDEHANDDNERLFSVVLTPHRSLGPRGFLILMSAFGIVSFAAGVAFVMMGAWPVFGYFGLDVALLYWAFRRSYGDAQIFESVDVTKDAVIVRKGGARRPVKEWRFIRYWVRVDLEENETLETCGPLFMRSHGTQLEIGSFLSPGERRGLASAITAAIKVP